MKQTIKSLPLPDKPYSHLETIVDLLLKNGNKLKQKDKFFLDKDGWRSDLVYPIDFNLLKANFDFPSSIILSEVSDSILCKNTWIEIKGGSV